MISQSKTTNSASHFQSSTGAFVGISRAIGLSSEFALTAGYIQNRSQRQIANNTVVGGIETASASFDSIMFNPSLSVPGVLGADDSLLSLSYLGLYSIGYTETGATANLTVANRLSHQVAASFQMTSHLTNNTAFRYGVDARYRTAAATNLTLAGTSVSIANANNGVSGRAFVSLDMIAGNGVSGSLQLGVSSDGQTDAGFTFKAAF